MGISGNYGGETKPISSLQNKRKIKWRYKQMSKIGGREVKNPMNVAAPKLNSPISGDGNPMSKVMKKKK